MRRPIHLGLPLTGTWNVYVSFLVAVVNRTPLMVVYVEVKQPSESRLVGRYRGKLPR